MDHPGYFDAPGSAEAFCNGQKDARPYIEGGCLWRLRGRNKFGYTLVSFTDPEEARDQARRFLSEGAKVQFLNYTSPRPSWAIDGPTEWLAPDGFDPFEGRSTKARKLLRRSSARAPRGMEEVTEIWSNWVSWADTRHFMVFKGHYLRWLNQWNDGDPRLELRVVETPWGRGLFGWENIPDSEWSQITIAKSEKGTPSKVLWVHGLSSVGGGPILCGSTADQLKRNLGLTPEKSWTAKAAAL